MYFTSEKFSIQTFDLNKIDQAFIEQSYNYSNKFPFKWNFFVNKIVGKKNVFFYRDTTVIININEIEFKKLGDVFEILKLYLNNCIIRKIIYKKEFAIIHFNELFHMELLTNKGILISIGLYYFLKKTYQKNFKTYLGAVLSLGCKKKIIPIIVKNDKKIYIFDSDNQFDYVLDENYVRIYLYDKMNINFRMNNDIILFKVDHSNNSYSDKLNKIFGYIK